MRIFIDAMKEVLNEDDHLPVTRPNRDINVIPGERAGRERTRSAGRGIMMPHRAGEHYMDAMKSGIRDNIDDIEAVERAGGVTEPNVAGIADEPQGELENHSMDDLPAVVSQGVGTPQRLEWHQIKHMPGYMASQIRGIARQIFGHLTDTPLEDIQTINTAMNPKHHVEAMAHWLTKNGTFVDEFDMDLGRIMPGYTAKAKLYDALGYQFFIMKDIMAEYIYVWQKTGNAIPHQDHLRVEGADPEIAAAYGDFMEAYDRTPTDDGFGDSAGGDPNTEEREEAARNVAKKRAERAAAKAEEPLGESMPELITSREDALERMKANRKAKFVSHRSAAPQAKKPGKDEPKPN